MQNLCPRCGSAFTGTRCDHSWCGYQKRHVSWLGIGLGTLLCLFGGTALVNPKATRDNRNIREGIHDVLGRPQESYNLIAATSLFFLTPGVVLLGRAFYSPCPSQVIAVSIAGFCFSFVLANFFFGRVDNGLLLFATIGAICIAYDLKCHRKMHEIDAPSSDERHCPHCQRIVARTTTRCPRCLSEISDT